MTIIKTIKFDLPIDGTKVKNIEELREHFTVEILELYNNGILLKWLRARKNIKEVSRLEAIPVALPSSISSLKALCDIFKVDTDDMILSAALGMPPEKMEKNFPEIKAQYRAIAKAEIEAKAKESIVSGKYLIHANRIVTDTETKLMWKQDSEVGQYTWDNAMKKFGKNVSFAGYNNWRMPTIEELKTLVDKEHSPTIDLTAFHNTPAMFWSASLHASNGDYAWFVNFDVGSASWYYKYGAFQVRLVRSGQ
ncbi:DUF1566 domain-containing protein [Thiothrix winogradskyi]|uniref:DUF1566 domain-containing protein n=1 Tax=Thiothrix winogradskyi TaxID=96472 RepID=A0ABY3SZE8_9GAMM|nr:DUF1566 domain-containing protein [Thiothrix winogradskyi]UJS23994.1 DUF1566 domain-containing protein [Thiothrix winogradskyi]